MYAAALGAATIVDPRSNPESRRAVLAQKGRGRARMHDTLPEMRTHPAAKLLVGRVVLFSLPPPRMTIAVLIYVVSLNRFPKHRRGEHSPSNILEIPT